MKTCTKCGSNPSLSYHQYCYGCLRIARGQSLVAKFRRDSSNKSTCSRCKKTPRITGQRYCSECRSFSIREWRKRHCVSWRTMTPEQRIKANARALANHWVQRGKMKKMPCEVCGNPDAGMHHEDYSKPLEVRWLCGIHHSEADRKKESFDKILSGK